MLPPILRLGVASIALSCLWASVCQAEDLKMHEGMVVSSGSDALVMKDAEGKQHSFKVGEDTKVTIHGKPGKIDDLKAGMPIRVTVGAEQRLLAVSTIDDKKCPTRLAY